MLGKLTEIVKRQPKSVNKGHNLNFDTLVTKSQREVAKIRADDFHGLRQEEFVFFNGKDKKVRLNLQPSKGSFSNPLPEQNMNWNHTLMGRMEKIQSSF